MCDLAYGERAWDDDVWPADGARRLDAARLYVNLRWLGDRESWTVRPSARRRFTELRRLGDRLELL
jgi:hypothetical protein